MLIVPQYMAYGPSASESYVHFLKKANFYSPLKTTESNS